MQKTFLDRVSKMTNESPTAKKIIETLLAQYEKGMQTYNVNIDNAGLSKEQLLQHAIEEAVDLVVYTTMAANSK